MKDDLGLHKIQKDFVCVSRASETYISGPIMYRMLRVNRSLPLSHKRYVTFIWMGQVYIGKIVGVSI